jgi:hypothetical protein
VLAAGAAPSAGSAPARARAAAVCADFPNQAAAQRAHNTRDGDGDGIYCEDLPCPCLKPGTGSAPSKPTHRPKHKARQPVAARCHTHKHLPDHGCTPGAARARVTATEVCTPGYSGRVRHVSETTKDQVYAEYGIASHQAGQYEVDHLISLELGGSNSVKNLWPEAAAPIDGFHQKDRVENELHREVCAGQITLHRAQRIISGDWVSFYRAHFPA